MRLGPDGTAAQTLIAAAPTGAVAKVLAARALHSDWIGKMAALSSLGVTPMGRSSRVLAILDCHPKTVTRSPQIPRGGRNGLFGRDRTRVQQMGLE